MIIIPPKAPVMNRSRFNCQEMMKRATVVEYIMHFVPILTDELVSVYCTVEACMGNGEWNATNGEGEAMSGPARWVWYSGRYEKEEGKERREGTYKPVSNHPASGAHGEANEVCVTVWFWGLLNVSRSTINRVART
ncbi:hypothetical protein CVT25_003900 [Psilocybe cyanescens]|uniref:Uncharacterized protein n=1 Tax=Psilocybe cyanescens TaxID=93625 RepID=A0A409XIW9_PSICY|nr:hypothetical protein CVT25_003900 [Psilocybe cyanescens]